MSIDRPSINLFLDSVGRNSKSTQTTYTSVLRHFQTFLIARYGGRDSEIILQSILEKKINVYELLDNFISFLVSTKPSLTHQSVFLYTVVMKSYFAYHDVDIIPAKFKRRVKMPKTYRQDEEPLDTKDVRKILVSCSNRRLKPLLATLASGGMRVTEGLAIRICDLDFSESPTKIHIRKEFAKTRVGRDIYISDEATELIKQWIVWKYRERTDNNKLRHRVKKDTDLVFAANELNRAARPATLYKRILKEFQKLLTVIGMDKRKEDGVYRRRKITIHSFRRFVKTVISDQVNQDYSEWFLGHDKSPYWTKKESEKRSIYATKCMKYLTFLDYSALETRTKNIEAKMEEKDRQIQDLGTQMKEILKTMYDLGNLKKE